MGPASLFSKAEPGATYTGTLFPKQGSLLQFCFSLQSFPQIIYADFPHLMGINGTGCESYSSDFFYYQQVLPYDTVQNGNKYETFHETLSIFFHFCCFQCLRAPEICFTQLQWLQLGEVGSVTPSSGMVQALPGGCVFAAPCLSCKREQAQRSSVPARQALPLAGSHKRAGNAGASVIILESVLEEVINLRCWEQIGRGRFFETSWSLL